MCGILAIINKEQSLLNSFIKSLSQLQHRGNESYGILYDDPVKKELKVTHFEGTIKDTPELTENIYYQKAIGHVRYSTVEKSDDPSNQQPMYSNKHDYYLVHNGNIPKYNQRFPGSDTKYILKIIDQEETLEKGLIKLISTLPGVYSLILLHKNTIYIARDRYGIRPLIVAGATDRTTITSESVSLRETDHYLFDLSPGSVVKIDKKIELIYQYTELPKPIYCSFEIIYFMHHLSKISDKDTVSQLRYRMGEILASKETSDPSTSAIVVAMPNTAIPSAQGFANTLKLPYFPYITKRPKSTRTFILPNNDDRIIACRKKFLFHKDMKDKIVYVIDDSIVRGNTLATTIKSLKELGVKEIHLRISSPPVISSCYYGIDIPTYEELITHNKTIPEICEKLGADSLNYLTVDELKNALGDKICTSCFDDKHKKELLEW